MRVVRSSDLHPSKPLYTEHHRRIPSCPTRSNLTRSAPTLGGESRLVLLGHGRESYYITHMFVTIMSFVEVEAGHDPCSSPPILRQPDRARSEFLASVGE